MKSEIEKYKFYYNIFIVCLSVQCFWGVVQEEMFTDLEYIKSYVFLLADAGYLALGLMVLKKRSDKIMIITFAALMFATNHLNSVGIATTINGSRDFWGMLFIAPFIRHYLIDDERREFFIRSFDKFILIFLIIQIPVAIYQCLLYGPHDRVGGTMGNFHSGVLSTLIYLLTFYLLQKKTEGCNTLIALSENWYYFLLLIPSMLNETKASFVFMLLMVISFFKINGKTLLRTIVIIPIVIFVLVPIATTIYLSVTGQGEEVFTLEYYTEMYLLDEESVEWALSDDIDAEGQDIPRFAKVLEGWNILSEDGALLLGKGVGLFKGLTTGSVAQIPFAIEYDWLLFGSIIMLFVMFMQLGILGMVWFVAYFIINSPNIVKNKGMNMSLYFFVFGVFVFLSFYNNSFNLPYFMAFFAYLLLVSKYPIAKTNN